MEDARHRRRDPQRLLVAGVDGVVGGNLALSLAGRFDTLGLFAHQPVILDGCRTVRCDPADPAKLVRIIRRETPHWIIHCGPLAWGSWDLPEVSPDKDHETHIWKALTEASCEAGSRLTVISSDAVFAGPRMFHDEKAPTTNPSPFAQAVRQAERGLEASHAIVVRTHAYGWSSPGTRPGFAEQIWEMLTEGATCRFAVDRHATPILATDLAELLLLAYRLGLEGLYHITGAERTSAYRFAAELAVAFGLKISPVPADDDPLRRTQPHHLDETSLSTRQARRILETPMPMLREGLHRFAQQATGGFRARLKPSYIATAVRGEAA